jgi:hypothetical protein
MEQENNSKISKLYLASVLLFMLILPVISIVIDTGYNSGSSIFYIGKWFVFWAIGIRLLTAGLRQVIKPEFTAKDILHIDSIESHIIVRELGFANICFGLAGVVSMYIPEWRTAAAFTGGLYMGIAGIQHIIKKPSTPNEMVAMVSDIFIFLVMAVYVGMMLF